MASVGHIAVGMAAARLYQTKSPLQRVPVSSMLLWSALSFLPDADVIGFGFGIRYGDAWGHRGATHSFVFSLALGVAVGTAAWLTRRPAVRTGVAAGLVLASHPLLDILTNGGLGCALFWPFDLTRYFAPWTPIPVSPIGLGFLSLYGMYVAAVELLLFAPLIWFALKPRLSPTVAVVVWLVALWLLLSTVPIRERRRTVLRVQPHSSIAQSSFAMSPATRALLTSSAVLATCDAPSVSSDTRCSMNGVTRFP
jgi:inner membrane protein